MQKALLCYYLKRSYCNQIAKEARRLLESAIKGFQFDVKEPDMFYRSYDLFFQGMTEIMTHDSQKIAPDVMAAETIPSCHDNSIHSLLIIVSSCVSEGILAGI